MAYILEVFMYTRRLVPLDASTLAEQALPYCLRVRPWAWNSRRSCRGRDPEPLSLLVNPDDGRTIDTLVSESVSAMCAIFTGLNRISTELPSLNWWKSENLKRY